MASIYIYDVTLGQSIIKQGSLFANMTLFTFIQIGRLEHIHPVEKAPRFLSCSVEIFQKTFINLFARYILYIKTIILLVVGQTQYNLKLSVARPFIVTLNVRS